MRSLRDRFWKAFWRRQAKHLPPTHHTTVMNCNVRMDKDATQPGISIVAGREWMRDERK